MLKEENKSFQFNLEKMIAQFLSDRDDFWFISKINFSGGFV